MKIKVFKTAVAYPEKPSFAIQALADPHRLLVFGTLAALAAALQWMAPTSLPPQEPRYLENDTPSDIVWSPQSGQVVEYERLSKEEVHELARLLKG